MNKHFDLSSLNTDVLNELRFKTDPLADKTVARIISSGFEDQINQVFMSLVQNDSISKSTFADFDTNLSQILNDYFEKSARMPTWLSKDQIAVGEQVFIDYGPEIFMLLNVSSLPMCYTCAKGAQVLYDTGRLLSHGNNVDPLARRLMETAQMILNVMSKGGLSPNGKGVITIQKIRLIHASIRYYLKHNQHNHSPWDTEVFGEPINQEDLAGTLMSFGPVIISGLKHLEINLSPEEISGYMHCWKVVGFLMGINDELLPDTYDDGFELACRILSHQSDESKAGKALTTSCIKFINYTMPGNAFDELPAFLIDYFLKDFAETSGKNLSKCIGIKNHEDIRDKIALSLSRYIVGEFSHLEDIAFVQKITQPFNKALLQGIIHHFNGGKDVHFLIPPSLKSSWKISEEWVNHKQITPDMWGNRLTWQKKKEIIN